MRVAFSHVHLRYFWGRLSEKGDITTFGDLWRFRGGHQTSPASMMLPRVFIPMAFASYLEAGERKLRLRTVRQPS